MTHDTFTLILTYVQTMPSFVELIFSFGRQHFAQDFNFLGFFVQNLRSRAVPDAGRSSETAQLCYNLRSPEKSSSEDEVPWTMRQAAVWHSLDLKSGHSTWICVKADKVIKDRIQKTHQRMQETSKYQPLNETLEHGLAAALATHVTLMDWAAEDWRWYVNCLEAKLQHHSRATLAVTADDDDSILDMMDKPPEKDPNEEPKPLLKRITESFSKKRPMLSVFTNPAPPPSDVELGEITERDQRSRIGFSVDTLQEVQEVSDKANEARLILRANARVLTDLKEYYHNMLASKLNGLPSHEYPRLIGDFEKRVESVVRSFEMEQERIELLLRMAEDRKGLVSFKECNFSILLKPRMLTQSSYMACSTMKMPRLVRSLRRKWK